MHAYSLSVQLFATPWPVAYQAPLSIELSRKEYWSGLPPPGESSWPSRLGSNLDFLHFLHWQADSLPLAPLRKPLLSISQTISLSWLKFSNDGWLVHLEWNSGVCPEIQHPVCLGLCICSWRASILSSLLPQWLLHLGHIDPLVPPVYWPSLFSPWPLRQLVYFLEWCFSFCCSNFFYVCVSG